MSYETLRFVVEDHVATVTLDRPERRNALNRAAYRELEAVFLEIQDTPEVRAVVLTGTDPAFCAGEDVKEMMTGTADAGVATAARLSAVRPRSTPAAAAVLDCDRPVIAAVNGVAVGWGMDLSLFADLRIASEHARFGEIFVRRGLVTDLGGLQRLPRIIGPQRAASLLYTGDIIDAQQALAWGLVLDVVPHTELAAAARDMASRIAANPPLAVRHMKEGLRRAYWGDHEATGSWISSTLGKLFQTEDHREGVKAFLEKREPHFQGR
jgi:enoyl-CoA hydratase/carnithine racemase